MPGLHAIWFLRGANDIVFRSGSLTSHSSDTSVPDRYTYDPMTQAQPTLSARRLKLPHGSNDTRSNLFGNRLVYHSEPSIATLG